MSQSLLFPVENGKVTAMADFVAGFVFGMTGDNELSGIETCFQGGELMYHEVDTGIERIKMGGWDNDAQAALEFGLVALQVPQSIKTCKGAETDIAALESWATIFTNPTELLSTVTKHFLLHKKEIKSDVAALEADWSNHLYFKSGTDLADLLTLAVGPVSTNNVTLPPLNLVPDFTAGLIYGFTGENHLDELRTCM